MNVIVNDRIYLTDIDPADQEACLQHLREREIYEHTLRIPFPYTAQHFQDWLAIVEQTNKEQARPLHFAIRDCGSFIGATGFSDLQIGKSHRAEIGYWLAKPYWGQGIMTSVVRRLCEFGFTELGIVKITASVFSDNTPSARVLEKCGFQLEGMLRKHYLKDGKFLDARAFALLRD